MLAHGSWIRKLTRDAALEELVISGRWREADLPAADREMLEYVEKLTLQPWEVEAEDINRLRAAGFSDAAIGDIATNASLFAFFNRIVDGLGGALEPGMAENARRFGYPLHPGTYEQASG